MKALRKIFLSLALGLMVLLAACSQNPLPQETLEPENHSDFHIASSSLIAPSTLNDICRHYYPLCKLWDESFYVIPVQVNPVCQRAICNNPIDILNERVFRFDHIMPGLNQTPTQFANSFKLELVDSSGKVMAQGLADTKTPRIMLSAKLPKGKFNLRVQILNADVAKLIQSSPSKYPFNFLVSAVK